MLRQKFLQGRASCPPQGAQPAARSSLSEHSSLARDSTRSVVARAPAPTASISSRTRAASSDRDNESPSCSTNKYVNWSRLQVLSLLIKICSSFTEIILISKKNLNLLVEVHLQRAGPHHTRPSDTPRTLA